VETEQAPLERDRQQEKEWGIVLDMPIPDLVVIEVVPLELGIEAMVELAEVSVFVAEKETVGLDNSTRFKPDQRPCKRSEISSCRKSSS